MVPKKKKSNAKPKAKQPVVGERKGRGKLGKYFVSGGPYAGKWLLLATAGTITFRVGQWFGRYNERCVWEDAIV